MKKGFTLIELLVVVSILGLLLSAVLLAMNWSKSRRVNNDIDWTKAGLDYRRQAMEREEVKDTGQEKSKREWCAENTDKYARAICEDLF